MDDRGFANYQRIVTAYPSQSMALLGIYITVTIAGVAGFFALTQSELDFVGFRRWSEGLSFICLFVTLMLWAIWYREHALKDQAVKEMKAANIQFPNTPKWSGVATAMITIFFLFGVVIWLLLFLMLVFNAQYLESWRGL